MGDVVIRHGENGEDGDGAFAAADASRPLPALDRLFVPASEAPLERIPAVGDFLPRVRRMPPVPFAPVMERYYVPDEQDIARAVREVLRWR